MTLVPLGTSTLSSTFPDLVVTGWDKGITSSFCARRILCVTTGWRRSVSLITAWVYGIWSTSLSERPVVDPRARTVRSILWISLRSRFCTSGLRASSRSAQPMLLLVVSCPANRMVLHRRSNVVFRSKLRGTSDLPHSSNHLVFAKAVLFVFGAVSFHCYKVSGNPKTLL